MQCMKPIKIFQHDRLQIRLNRYMTPLSKLNNIKILIANHHVYFLSHILNLITNFYLVIFCSHSLNGPRNQTILFTYQDLATCFPSVCEIEPFQLKRTGSQIEY